ncbi:C3a anaphylatoxin chemotactic receptor-like [Tachysurus fulvidraco]|uniref:C3a anaphylatoxin chemotactic receptor-like n=1 Tax=Tachysurus fulvidraco TaxID=1234273 RepID=UPI001FEEBACB|nr:C3a anaphylatoxin chemotactic receptor-like [Tachysurus fulvidraco]XP_047674813.1 C3a anaphylatoxin chemotactic receptor-like [Tachysurus fulvidraco]
MSSSELDEYYEEVVDQLNCNASFCPPDPSEASPVAPGYCTDVTCALLAVANVIIVLLGIAGNGLVIWIAGFKIKKTVNAVWYLSLAVSDFLFCAFLPLSVVYIIRGEWEFGSFMCKFASFILTLNMFSSIFLLLIISVDRCVLVMFPVWAQNMRNLRRALVMVLLAWIGSALLSLPMAIFQQLDKKHKKCFSNYQKDEEHIAVTICRFIFGFVIPFLFIITCYFFIIRKLRSNQMARSKKPFKVMTTLIVAFFICWMPYHIFKLLELNVDYEHVIPTGQKFGITLASANSFMNPLLYAFMGKDFKRKCYAILSKIESTFEEETRSTHRGTSITYPGDSKLLTTV